MNEQLMVAAWKVRKENFPDEIEFDFPVHTKSISVTGGACDLKCSHCNGHYLKNMIPISDWRQRIGPETSSCLVSGGCDWTGTVPLTRSISLIKDIRDSGRKTNLHVGLVEDEEIDKLCAAADVISFDFVGDDKTIQEVYGLHKTVQDYVRVYNGLREKAAVLPHICIGLHGGEIRGEYKALELLKGLGTVGLVFIVFIPTGGTPFADRQPPALREVAHLLATARIEFPKIPIHLGCMRPKGRYRVELDQLAIRCGINKLVQPTPPAIELAKSLELSIKRGEECCVI